MAGRNFAGIARNVHNFVDSGAVNYPARSVVVVQFSDMIVGAFGTAVVETDHIHHMLCAVRYALADKNSSPDPASDFDSSLHWFALIKGWLPDLRV